MAEAEPKCPRCGERLIPLLNIGFFCKRDCDRTPVPASIASKEHCPKCNSPDIETFVLPWSSFGGWPNGAMRCVPCGHVFEKR